MRPSFCNNPHWNATLYNLVQQKIFQFDNYSGAENLYSSFSDSYNEKPASSFVSPLFQISYSSIPSYNYIQKYVKGISYAGIDVPTYFNYHESSLKIMIVGIDPLRSGDQYQDVISLGTPYNLHNNRDIIYWQLIKGLTEKLNATVYLTDTFKLYFRSGNKRSYDISEFTNPEQKGDGTIHQDIFAEEVKLVNPDLIVTLGKHPRLWFTNIKQGGYSYKRLLDASNDNLNEDYKKLFYDKYPVLPLMHLSPLVRNNTRMTNYGVSSNEQIIEKYIDIIGDKLKQTKS